jgi:nucleoside-diphosphate-sugar epimerase
VREIGVRRLARRAAADAAAVRTALGDRPLVVVSTALAWGDRTDGPAGEDDPERRLSLALPALAAERALAHPGLRVVRLPWVYGDGGLLHQVGWALAHGRYRVVGPGDNRWALISAEDAAAALILAADADPGVYAVAEPDAPTQGAVVAAFCSRPGVRRPDHVPVGLASLAMGRAMSRALAASLELRPGRLADLGWSPSADWRRDLLSRTGRPRPGAG